MVERETVGCSIVHAVGFHRRMLFAWDCRPARLEKYITPSRSASDDSDQDIEPRRRAHALVGPLIRRAMYTRQNPSDGCEANVATLW